MTSQLEEIVQTWKLPLGTMATVQDGTLLLEHADNAHGIRSLLPIALHRLHERSADFDLARALEKFRETVAVSKGK
jgi:hypothetical protein